MPSKQFYIWMGLSVPTFVATGLAVEALGLAPMWAFAVGVTWSIPMQLLDAWLLDWQAAEQEVGERAA